jgi:glycosyltransferase involved in cell wall biosynthesis
MEAMASGRPAIVSDMGGLPELVEDGANGFVFRSGDARELCGAMRKMKDLSGKEYEDMSRNALEKACARFDAGRYVDRIMELYSELKQNGRREPV